MHFYTEEKMLLEKVTHEWSNDTESEQVWGSNLSLGVVHY